VEARIQEYFAANTEYQRAYTNDFEISGLVPNHVKIYVSVKKLR
jgi:hypothetical protein